MMNEAHGVHVLKMVIRFDSKVKRARGYSSRSTYFHGAKNMGVL